MRRPSLRPGTLAAAVVALAACAPRGAREPPPRLEGVPVPARIEDRLALGVATDLLPHVRRDTALRIVVDLARQPDLDAIARDVPGTRPAERAAPLLDELDRATLAARRDLEAWLALRVTVKDVVRYRCLSRVAFTADEPTLREVVKRPDVAHAWARLVAPPPGAPVPHPPDPGGEGTAWAARAVRAEEAWARGATGRGVLVAVMDSGHPEALPALAGRRSAAGTFDAAAGADVPGTIDEGRGHGTAVLGVAVAPDGLGIAPEATWTMASPIVAGQLDPEGLAAAVDWLLATARPDVVVVPWDVPDEMPEHALALPFGALRASGAVVVFPAGNVGPVRGVSAPPANLVGLAPDGGRALAVGAVDEQGTAYAYSCRGPNPRDGAIFPRVAAPGVALAVLTEDGLGLRVGHGTSFAAAVAGGAAALVLSARPELTGWQVERLLEGTARDLGPAGADHDTGYGLVDVVAALDAPAPVGAGSP